MSYRCNSCLYIYKSKKNNCPYCGGRIYQNNTSDDELISEGFSYDVSINSETPDNQVLNTESQADYYAKLQEDYRKEHLATTKANDPAPSPSIAPSPGIVNTTVDEKTQNANDKNSIVQGGYFSQFTAETAETTPPVIPTIERPAANSQQIAPSYHDAEYDAEMRRLEEQQRRIQRDYNRIAFSNFLHNIPWRAVFRVISIISVIVFLIFIWQMRYVILESIMNFLISLIPLALVIGIFWYLIKSFFKK